MDDTEANAFARISECKEKGKEAAEILTKGLNIFTNSGEEALIEGFVEGVTRDHRTLQQKAGRLIYEVLKAWAHDYETGNYDARNEQTVSMAKTMMNAMPKDISFPFI